MTHFFPVCRNAPSYFRYQISQICHLSLHHCHCLPSLSSSSSVIVINIIFCHHCHCLLSALSSSSAYVGVFHHCRRHLLSSFSIIVVSLCHCCLSSYSLSLLSSVVIVFCHCHLLSSSQSSVVVVIFHCDHHLPLSSSSVIIFVKLQQPMTDYGAALSSQKLPTLLECTSTLLQRGKYVLISKC